MKLVRSAEPAAVRDLDGTTGFAGPALPDDAGAVDVVLRHDDPLAAARLLADAGVDVGVVDGDLGRLPHLDPAASAIAPDDLDDVRRFETLGSLVDRVERHPDSTRAGGLATFTGRVRVENHENVETTHLEFERYDALADERIAAIRDDLTARDEVYAVEMYHRTGVVAGEEHVVHVVVLAGHRRQAFDAVEDGIDRMKDEVPIFKKEVTVEGDYWVHESDAEAPDGA